MRDKVVYPKEVYNGEKTAINETFRDLPTEYENNTSKILKILKRHNTILDLSNKNTYTLYELDKNEELQNKIMKLIPEIRKWFSFNGIKAVGNPDKIKRPWLSIIKHLTKERYNLESKEYRFFNENEKKYERTQ